MAKIRKYTPCRDTIQIHVNDTTGYTYKPDIRWENIIGDPQKNGQLMDLLFKFYTGEDIDISEYIKTVNQDIVCTKEEYDNIELTDDNLTYFITN